MSRQKRVHHPLHHVRTIGAWGLLLLALLSTVAACRIAETPSRPENTTLHEEATTTPDRGTELPFETIVQEKSAVVPKGWSRVDLFEGEEPALFVITRPEETANVDRWVFPEPLSTLDFEREFALVVFQGYRDYYNYGVTIKRVTRLGNVVDIFAEFQTPTPEMEMLPASSSPYHVIRIQKLGTWEQEITFNLIANDEPILSRTHYVP